MNLIERTFRTDRHQTTLKQELLAGITSYLTVVYIIIVNGAILSDSGIPFEAAVMATIVSSWIGCLLMGFWANAPIVLVPGMGINAFFTYTMVHDMGFTWQEALAVVVVSGFLFTAAAFSRLSILITTSLPDSLKKGITVGIGLLITFIGLQKGGIIVSDPRTFVAVGDLRQPGAWLTLITLMLILFLFARKIRGSFLLGILAATLVAKALNMEQVSPSGTEFLSLKPFLAVAGSLSLAKIATFPFWTATFALVLVLVFENIGLLQGLLKDKSKFLPAFQASALSTINSGFAGTSPTVCALESATGISAGGKTGLTAITTGFLLLLSALLIPLIQWIPDSSIAAVLIVVGGLMVQEVQSIPFSDLTEGIPAFITFTFIPFTYSIPTGIAFGFIAYAILKLVTGKAKEAPFAFYAITCMFCLQLILHP
ncbi:putative MFS transporter, AGZA family, xanthine/uracil permease [Lihuaxuella thermophila]|uniref:Putative MFS transporter, AGZA family, xanthine/uracil permease n=1 Tax=Lihuaxuella thermophila TaxID=1173111 RepID=A0A1H8F7F2_9BACL|nr:putative MFS transporter, AGZA family, xanthine/uracil permease [Lihuaxuella thermophila]